MAVRMVFAASLMALVSVAVVVFGLLLILARLWACVVACCMSCAEMVWVRGSWSRVRAWAIAVHASGLVLSRDSAAVLRSELFAKCCVKGWALFGCIVARRGRLCALYAYTGSVFPDVVFIWSMAVGNWWRPGPNVSFIWIFHCTCTIVISIQYRCVQYRCVQYRCVQYRCVPYLQHNLV